MTDAEYQFELGRAYDKGYREAEALFMSMCSRDGVCGCHRWWHYPSKGEYPTETDDYLVYVNTKAVRDQKIMAIATYYVGAKEWNIDTDEYEFKYPPIAWMPLPDPPKEEA